MNIVAIASGGVDSATLLYSLLDEGHEVKALGIDYGQRNKCELLYLRRICNRLEIDYEIADISTLQHLIAGESSQTNPDIEVPEGHYADECMKTTVVPNRNMLMLSIAIGHAISIEYDAVAYGAHRSEGLSIYPDCRAEFASAMQTAALLCDWKQIELLRPLIGLDKTGVVTLGNKLGVPFEDTWTCYKGLEKHCGKCGSCVKRKEAFEQAGLEDPAEYEGQ